jgi:hypothetical protein
MECDAFSHRCPPPPQAHGGEKYQTHAGTTTIDPFLGCPVRSVATRSSSVSSTAKRPLSFRIGSIFSSFHCRLSVPGFPFPSWSTKFYHLCNLSLPFWGIFTFIPSVRGIKSVVLRNICPALDSCAFNSIKTSVTSIPKLHHRLHVQTRRRRLRPCGSRKAPIEAASKSNFHRQHRFRIRTFAINNSDVVPVLFRLPSVAPSEKFLNHSSAADYKLAERGDEPPLSWTHLKI